MAKQLLIIPGWGGTRKSWNNFIEIAEKEIEVYFVDMPCFGDIPCPQEIWGVEEYADFVKTKIAELGLNKPIILGHSFGGQVAVNLVAQNPDLAERLVLSGAAVIRPNKTFKRAILIGVTKVGKCVFKMPILNKAENLAKKILYKAVDSPDYNKTDGVKREIFKKVIRQNQEDKLEKIMVPTLVVWGSADSYVSLKYGKRIASLIPNAKLEIIEGGRHGLHIQQPENLLRIVKEFLDKV